MSYTTVTTKGQVVIPEEIRKQLNIKPGVRILVSVENGHVVMKIDDFKSKISSFRSKIKSHLKTKNINKVTDEDINNAKNNLWKNRNQK